jgi:glutathione S-transferase
MEHPMKIELFYTPRTRASRPRWLLEELELPYTLHPVDLMAGERNLTHPLGAVPSIRIEDSVLIESGAICHWLTDRFPDKGLAPALEDPLRIRYEQWMYFTPGTLEPPAFDILLHTYLLPEAQRVAAVVPFARHCYDRVLEVLSDELDHHGFLLGTEFSTADIMLATTLNWLPDLLEPYPVLQAYVTRATARPAWQRAQRPVRPRTGTAARRMAAATNSMA